MSASPQSIFDATYWASFPPQVAALQSMQVDIETPSIGGRTMTAMDLAAQGFVIDVPIMIWGWDPYLTMFNRQQYGFTWVPSALQPAPTIAPGVSQPGAQPYNPNNPPTGSIKVSTNPVNYPPFAAPPPSPTITELVGPQIVPGVNQYYAVYGDTSPAGTKFSDARGQFVKKSTPASTPFGNAWFWWAMVVPEAIPTPPA